MGLVCVYLTITESPINLVAVIEICYVYAMPDLAWQSSGATASFLPFLQVYINLHLPSCRAQRKGAHGMIQFA